MIFILVRKVNNISTTDSSSFVKKTDHNTKISEFENKITTDHDKNISAQEFNKLTSQNFAARLAQANFASKNDIASLVKKDRF